MVVLKTTWHLSHLRLGVGRELIRAEVAVGVLVW